MNKDYITAFVKANYNFGVWLEINNIKNKSDSGNNISSVSKYKSWFHSHHYSFKFDNKEK